MHCTASASFNIIKQAANPGHTQHTTLDIFSGVGTKHRSTGPNKRHPALNGVTCHTVNSNHEAYENAFTRICLSNHDGKASLPGRSEGIGMHGAHGGRMSGDHETWNGAHDSARTRPFTRALPYRGGTLVNVLPYRGRMMRARPILRRTRAPSPRGHRW